MPRPKTKAEVGAALERVPQDVKKEALGLVSQYRNADIPAELDDDLMIQALDSPQRAKARFEFWIANYDAANGGGAAVVLLNSCLTAAGSVETVASLNAQLTALEAQAQVLVDHRNNDAWTWDQVADAIEAGLTDSAGVDFGYNYRDLPLPPGYVTVFGTPY